jgi:serine/threonine-protein kinase
VIDDSALPHVGDIVGGKYRIEHQLGAGGMSAVFAVRHLVTDRRFAIKWLLPELARRTDGVRRFVREAKVAGRVDHPNIVEIYDFGEAEDSFYMVMELLEGEPLDQRLQREGKLSPPEACRILLPCMRGVAHAHAAGVIHRDLKPGNIFLCSATSERPELPKVLDFGISRVSDLEVTRESPITDSGVWMGTPHYMSPEQVRGRPLDHRADVYAFGVILYELLSGEPPFHSDSLNELMVQVAAEDPPLLHERVPEIEPALSAIVHRAMARAPSARFPNLESMVQALAPFASGAESARAVESAATVSPAATVAPAPTPAPAAAPVASEQTLRSKRGRGRRLLSAAAVLAVMLGAGAFAASRSPRVHESRASVEPREDHAARSAASARTPAEAARATSALAVSAPPASGAPATTIAAPSAHAAQAGKPHTRASRPHENAGAQPAASNPAPAETAPAPVIASSAARKSTRSSGSAGAAARSAKTASGDALLTRGHEPGPGPKPESLSGVTFDLKDFMPRSEAPKPRAPGSPVSSR